MNLEEGLCGTDFTIGWLLNSINENDETFKADYSSRKIINVSARDIGGGKGMFSMVLKCKLSFEDSRDENDVYTTILKIPGTYVFDAMNEKNGAKENEQQQNLSEKFNIPGMHATEVKFYGIFKNKMQKILPKVYYAQNWIPGKQQGCLHMEDLSKNGTSLNFYESLNQAQIQSVARGMAHFYKELICCDEKEWKGKFPINEHIFENLDGVVNNFCKTFSALLKTDAQKAVFDSYLNDPKLGKLIRSTKFARYTSMQSNLDYGIPNSLVHCDLWSNNIFFKQDTRGFISNEMEAILDWQILQEGNIASGFARLLTCSCDGDIRREAETYIFDFFVDCLNEELQKAAKPSVSYTGKQLRELYEGVFIMYTMHPVFMTSLCFASKTSSPAEKPIDDARIDRCILRALHTCEDAKKYMDTGKYDKWIL